MNVSQTHQTEQQQLFYLADGKKFQECIFTHTLPSAFPATTAS
jgi:hypothetical protein